MSRPVHSGVAGADCSTDDDGQLYDGDYVGVGFDEIISDAGGDKTNRQEQGDQAPDNHCERDICDDCRCGSLEPCAEHEPRACDEEYGSDNRKGQHYQCEWTDATEDCEQQDVSKEGYPEDNFGWFQLSVLDIKVRWSK